MTETIKLDNSNRLVIPRHLRRSAGFLPGQKLKITAAPGRIVLEIEPSKGRIVKKGKFNTWSGLVPAVPLEDAIETTRRHWRWHS